MCKKMFPMLLLVLSLSAQAAVIYETPLAQGTWSMDDWEMVKSPRSDYRGEWVQHPDMIVNKVPDGTDPATFVTSSTTTFTGMLFKRSFSGDITISMDCKFAYRMAPGILIAAEPLRKNGDRTELAEHFEIILYDNGLNIWFHYFENGTPKYVKKSSFLEKGVFTANKFHRLTVKFYTRKGKRFIDVYGGDKLLSAYTAEITGSFKVGIVGSEGVNSFRNIQISTP